MKKTMMVRLSRSKALRRWIERKRNVVPQHQQDLRGQLTLNQIEARTFLDCTNY